jgi:predicted protein tyrosine phosphatase
MAHLYYQAKMIIPERSKVLFTCAQNKIRSIPAEKIFEGSQRYHVRQTMGTDTMHRAKFDRLILWVVPVLIFIYSAIRWSSAWSPMHETKQYVICVTIGLVYGAIMLWMVTIPALLLAILIFFFARKRCPAAALPISISLLCLVAIYVTEFWIVLANDS